MVGKRLKVYGWHQEDAIDVLKSALVGVKAKMKINSLQGQNIKTFEDFFCWFDVAWDISTLRTEIYNKCKNYTLPEDTTIQNIVTNYQAKYKLLEQTTQYLVPIIKINTTLSQTQQIKAIINALKPDWLNKYKLFIPKTMTELRQRFDEIAKCSQMEEIQNIDNPCNFYYFSLAPFEMENFQNFVRRGDKSQFVF